jgi:hypothetical protein
MPNTPQHGLLARLLDYVVEQSKEIDPRAFGLTGAPDFRCSTKDLAGLPGVELDRKVEGDHIALWSCTGYPACRGTRPIG